MKQINVKSVLLVTTSGEVVSIELPNPLWVVERDSVTIQDIRWSYPKENSNIISQIRNLVR